MQQISFANISLDPNAAKDLEKMNKDFFTNFGFNLSFSSAADGYRTFNQQVLGHTDKIEKNVCHLAAEPGKSPHGLGLAVDVNTNAVPYQSKYYNWLHENGGKYNI